MKFKLKNKEEFIEDLRNLDFIEIVDHGNEYIIKYRYLSKIKKLFSCGWMFQILENEEKENYFTTDNCGFNFGNFKLKELFKLVEVLRKQTDEQ